MIAAVGAGWFESFDGRHNHERDRRTYYPDAAAHKEWKAL